MKHAWTEAKSYNWLQIPIPITTVTISFPLDGCDTKQRYHRSPRGSQYSSLEHSSDSTWPKKSSSVSALMRKRRLFPPQCHTLPCVLRSIFQTPSWWEECNLKSSKYQKKSVFSFMLPWLWGSYIHASFGTKLDTLGTWSEAAEGGPIPCCHSGLPQHTVESAG